MQIIIHLALNQRISTFMPEDTYKTIAKPAEGLYKEKGSKFLAFAYPVCCEVEVDAIMSQLRKQYYDARHHCYAYRLGADMKRFRANDDGEPNNTAGNPILGQIRSKELSDTLVVVVRYFGGILLGASGLVHAYKTAAAEALAHAEIVVKTVKEPLFLVFEYVDMDKVMRIVKDEKLEMSDQKFDLDCQLTVYVPASRIENIKQRFESIPSLHFSC